MEKFDVVIVGSGIGGLCCGSILALSGKKVLICEAHSQPGGVAHSFKRNGYTFESGPSLWSGIGKWPTSIFLTIPHIKFRYRFFENFFLKVLSH